MYQIGTTVSNTTGFSGLTNGLQWIIITFETSRNFAMISELADVLSKEQQEQMLVVREWLEASHKEKQEALNNRAAAVLEGGSLQESLL